MHGLPSDFDVSIFSGRTLESVCFMQYAVRLSFDDDLAITLEASYAQRTGSTAQAERVEIPIRTSSLMQLLGLRILSADVEDGGTLVLKFEGGQLLYCFDDSPQYESYHILFRGKETHV